MKQEMLFTSPAEYKAGTIFGLLALSWEPLMNPQLEENLRTFDREVYENPHTVGACTFISVYDNTPVGMVSYDPRQKPEKGIIGYNCIIPEYQQRGFGSKQIKEIISIFRQKGFEKAEVSTGEEDFFVPAQRMYESCGFKELKREEKNIYYSMDM